MFDYLAQRYEKILYGLISGHKFFARQRVNIAKMLKGKRIGAVMMPYVYY
jgi:hypothetical protein